MIAMMLPETITENILLALLAVLPIVMNVIGKGPASNPFSINYKPNEYCKNIEIWL